MEGCSETGVVPEGYEDAGSTKMGGSQVFCWHAGLNVMVAPLQAIICDISATEITAEEMEEFPWNKIPVASPEYAKVLHSCSQPSS